MVELLVKKILLFPYWPTLINKGIFLRQEIHPLNFKI